MRRSAGQAVAVFGATLVLFGTACSAILGLRDGTLTGDGGAGDGGSDVNPPRDVIDLTDANFGNCGDAGRADEPTIVHVDQTAKAVDVVGCGGVDLPCRTLGFAITVARGKTTKKVFVGPGVYNENVTLTNADDGLVIEGGWTPSWTPDCNTSLARIKGSASVNDGTLVISGAKNIIVRLLTIESRAQGGVGESVYAVRVENATGTLTFDNVAFLAQNGGDGMPGQPGNTFQSGCGAGTGTDGGPGTPGTLGSFDPQGYSPTTAAQGDPGQAGMNGPLGAPGALGTSCVECSMIFNNGLDGGLKDGGTTCQQDPPVSTPQGGSGSAGCGGSPGGGGSGGAGGGASVALYAIGGSPSAVIVRGGALISNSGGAGGNGGAGAPGDDGTAGAQGASIDCPTSCHPAPDTAACNSNPCNKTCITLDGGAGGSAGGKGGHGGPGGGGHGGPTYLVVNGNKVVQFVADPAPKLNLGSGGAGGSANGVKGEALPTKPVP